MFYLDQQKDGFGLLKTILKAMKKHHTPQLIHGHTHRPQIQSLDFKINGIDVRKISLGCWAEQKGSYLKYYSDGKFQLQYFGY